MSFNSLLFLCLFLPTFIILFYIFPRKYRFIIALIFSLIFYLYSGLFNFSLIIFLAVINFLVMLIYDKYNKKIIPNILIIINILFLLFFKYTTFFLFPLGISFYTFNNISYIIEVKRKNVKCEKNFLHFLFYVTLFTHVTMGPITNYNLINKNIGFLDPKTEDVLDGFKRFIWGLIKKVLIADSLGLLYNAMLGDINRSFTLNLFCLIIFGLQLYIDFSSYTDMAIGLGKMIGISYKENFNYPYLATSVSDFWRRWHMSLTNFFKEYVYIPMGGNKVNIIRHILNILTVWLLTGIWHGNHINFVIWGLYYGVILIIEKYLLKNILDKLPKIVKHLYVITIVIIGYIFFSISDFNDMIIFIKDMFTTFINSNVIFYFKENLFLIVVSIILCFKVPEKVQNLFNNKYILIIQNIGYFVLYILTIAYILSGSFSPFLYNAF